MKSKLIATAAATLLASTVFAAAQMDGAPSNERDRTGATTDSSQNSAQPERRGPQPGGTVGGPNVGGAMGDTANPNPSSTDNTPLQPGGISPSAPPQGQSSGGSAHPRPR